MLAYLQKPAVQMVLFATAVAGAGVFFFLQDSGRGGKTGTAKEKKPDPPKGMSMAALETVAHNRRELKGVETAESHDLDRLVLPPAKSEPAPVSTGKAKSAQKPKPPVFPDLVQINTTAKAKPFVPQPPKVFAPRGTLIKAALVITLESNVTGTPVLAMVTEDVYFQGNLIVPAGTQVQGSAAGGSKIRDRLDVRGTFTFVWADGSEYSINGIALDHQPLEDGTFALTDGSPGIRGRILKTDDYAELKLLIAEAVKGLTNNSQTQFQSIYGLVPENTNRNAALGAGSSGVSAYSNLLAKKLEKDIEYVQVPAGTSFYIYTLDVFEPELRSIAGIRQGNKAKSGLELQEESYNALLTQATAREGDLKQAADTAKAAEAAAAKASAQQAQIERTRALLGSGGPRPGAEPEPEDASEPAPAASPPAANP